MARVARSRLAAFAAVATALVLSGCASSGGAPGAAGSTTPTGTAGTASSSATSTAPGATSPGPTPTGSPPLPAPSGSMPVPSLPGIGTTKLAGTILQGAEPEMPDPADGGRPVRAAVARAEAAAR